MLIEMHINMSTIKSRNYHQVNICEKCAGEMYDRKMYLNGIEPFIKIKQCFICRFWYREDN